MVAVGFWLIGTRRMLSRYANMDDLPDQVQSQLHAQAGALEELLVDRRDGLLVSALDAIRDQHGTEPTTVAVVYGPATCPAWCITWRRPMATGRGTRSG